jgi:hypothetical protein
MARPLRLEVANTTYLISARGVPGHDLFATPVDHRLFLDLLGRCSARYRWRVLAYCMTPSAYHLLLTLSSRNLATGLRYLNSAWTVLRNRREARYGALFKGRYEAVVVDPVTALPDALQRVLLAPWREQLAGDATGWPWSSYRATLAPRVCADWLAADELLAALSPDPETSRAVFEAAVSTRGQDREPPVLPPRRCLGPAVFLDRLRAIARAERALGRGDARSAPPPLQPPAGGSRREAMLAAYASGIYTQQDLARHFGVHAATVSRQLNAGRPLRTGALQSR